MPMQNFHEQNISLNFKEVIFKFSKVEGVLSSIKKNSKKGGGGGSFSFTIQILTRHNT